MINYPSMITNTAGTSTTVTSTTPYITTTNNTGGYVITNSGTSAPGWVQTDTFITSSPGKVLINGDAEFQGDIKIKGKSLGDRLDKIEERLAILQPNKKLEKKWEKLKELGEQYRELERDILEKEKIMEILKR